MMEPKRFSDKQYVLHPVCNLFFISQSAASDVSNEWITKISARANDRPKTIN